VTRQIVLQECEATEFLLASLLRWRRWCW